MVIFERITIPIKIGLKPRIWKLKSQRTFIKFLDHKYKLIFYPTVNFPISAEVTVGVTGIIYTSNLRAILKRLKDKHLLISRQYRQYRHKTRKKKLKIAKWTGRKSKFEIAIFVVAVAITADVFIRKSEFNLW